MAIRLSDKKIRLLLDIGEHGLLDTLMIKDRHYADTTLRNCQKVLTGLCDANYLVSTKLTVAYAIDRNGRQRTIEKRIPAVHALTADAADELELLVGSRPTRIATSSPSPNTLFHRRAAVQARIAFDSSCEIAGLPTPEWLLESDYRTDLDKDVPPNQRSMLFHRCKLGERFVSIRPDMACLLRIPNGCGEHSRLGLYWEIDRSTEGMLQLSRTKASGYRALLEQEAYQRYWPAVDHIRICWAVPSKARIDTIMQVMSDEAVADPCRFLVAAELDGQNLLTDRIWYTASGERRSIYAA